MKQFLKNIVLLGVAIFLAYILGKFFSNFYDIDWRTDGGLYTLEQRIVSPFLGSLLAYALFLSILFMVFGDDKKYVWLGALVLPAVIFIIYLDLLHLYLLLIFGLLGWGIGFGVSKLMKK